MDPARRVLYRYLAAKAKEIPVRNKETGRIVYVLPETLKERPGDFEKVPLDKVDPPHLEGKPDQADKPRKPSRPYVPRDPLPRPEKLPKPKKPKKPIKPPKLVKPVKPVPVPRPPKKPYRPLPPGRKRQRDPKEAALNVVRRFLLRQDPAV